LTRQLINIGSYGLRLLPISAVAILGRWIGFIWFSILRFRRATVLSNLTLAFGKEKDLKELNLIARNNCDHYGITALEIIRSATWSKEEFKRQVTLHGVENLEPFMKDGKGGFLLASHMGNWEFAVTGTAAHGINFDVIVKRPRQKSVEDFLESYRTRTGAGVIYETNSMSDIWRAVGSGRWVGFILDQFMGPPIGLPVKFFGHLAGTAVGLALLTEKRQAPVIPLYSYRDESGRCHTVFEKPIDFSQCSRDRTERLYEKTQLFNDAIERGVRRYPSQWMWLHRRWKSFNGEPRWKLADAIATGALCLSLMLGGCASPGDSPTGIALPVDPQIAVPKYVEKPNAVELPVPKPLVQKQKRVVPTKTSEATVAPQAFQVVEKYAVPFQVGEQLEMSINWMALPAGRAILQVRNAEPFQGRPLTHLWGNILSSKLVDTIYHVDNTIESFVDSEGLIPYKFLLHMAESVQKKETRVVFDHPNGKAHYWAKRISAKWGDSNDDRVDEFKAHSQDMFSALFYGRVIDWRIGKKEIIKVFENGQNLDIEATPVATEVVTTKAGTFQASKIAVMVKLNNIFKPMGDMFLWYSDDSKRYPVRFEAKVKIGSLWGELLSVKAGN